jgi:hypothetical protein
MLLPLRSWGKPDGMPNSTPRWGSYVHRPGPYTGQSAALWSICHTSIGGAARTSRTRRHIRSWQARVWATVLAPSCRPAPLANGTTSGRQNDAGWLQFCLFTPYVRCAVPTLTQSAPHRGLGLRCIASQILSDRAQVTQQSRLLNSPNCGAY